MPYIKNERRAELESITELSKFIESLSKVPDISEGDLNYIITSLLVAVLGDSKSYAAINDLVGVLECAKLEFYRRVAGPYEDQKVRQNGDVY